MARGDSISVTFRRTLARRLISTGCDGIVDGTQSEVGSDPMHKFEESRTVQFFLVGGLPYKRIYK